MLSDSQLPLTLDGAALRVCPTLPVERSGQIYDPNILFSSSRTRPTGSSALLCPVCNGLHRWRPHVRHPKHGVASCSNRRSVLWSLQCRPSRASLPARLYHCILRSRHSALLLFAEERIPGAGLSKHLHHHYGCCLSASHSRHRGSPRSPRLSPRRPMHQR